MNAAYYIQLFRERFGVSKPYARMPKGIMGNGGLWSLIEDLGVSATQSETAQTNVFMSIGIVAYAFTLLWDNLC